VEKISEEIIALFEKLCFRSEGAKKTPNRSHLSILMINVATESTKSDHFNSSR
jgi:hypothetical protein